MDGNKQSFEALEQADKSRVEEEEEEEEPEEEEEEFDDEGEVGEERQLSELESSIAQSEAELRGSQSETLTVHPSLHLSENDLQSDFSTSVLSDVPLDYSLLRPLKSSEFMDQVGVSCRKALVTVTAQAAQVQMQNQHQSHGCPTSSPELSPTSVTQSISSDPSPTLLKQKHSPLAIVNGACTQEEDQQNSADTKPISTVPVVRTLSADGYNWRKYGQKQVKSPQGSRSYYKCAYSDCYAKKIECSDHSNHVIEIICKGWHNHDPPRKINCTRERRLALSAAPNITPHSMRMPNGSDPSTSSKEPIQETRSLPETKRQNSNSSDRNTAEIDIKEEHVDEPEPKRRMKKSDSENSASLVKSGKKPKFVVHAAGDVGISGDGYRWRKYGQKMVKGNPHPRNYYRCTSAGCPVRKHTERAIDDASAVIITYKGVHDHDMPVPKKRHGPPSAPLVAAASPASLNNLQSKKTEAFQNQLPRTQWSVDTEGELTAEALDLGEEKAMESARTLLSIGFEIKPC